MGAKLGLCAVAMTHAVLAGKTAGMGAITYGALAFLLRAVMPQDLAFLSSSIVRRWRTPLTARFFLLTLSVITPAAGLLYIA